MSLVDFSELVSGKTLSIVVTSCVTSKPTTVGFISSVRTEFVLSFALVTFGTYDVCEEWVARLPENKENATHAVNARNKELATNLRLMKAKEQKNYWISYYILTLVDINGKSRSIPIIPGG